MTACFSLAFPAPVDLVTVGVFLVIGGLVAQAHRVLGRGEQRQLRQALRRNAELEGNNKELRAHWCRSHLSLRAEQVKNKHLRQRLAERERCRRG